MRMAAAISRERRRRDDPRIQRTVSEPFAIMEAMKTTLSALIAAATIGMSIPAWAANSSEAAAASDQTPAANQPSQGGSEGKAAKHPPTAAMDRAVPPEKSASQKPTDKSGAAGKHPPTGAMDRAVSEQKSPDGSAGSADATTDRPPAARK